MSSKKIALAEAQPPFFVGIDLGGTNIKLGVVDDLGRTLSWLTIPTQPERGPEDATKRMGTAVLRAISEAGLMPDKIAYAGLGSPGTMDIAAGKLLKPVNLKGWDNFPIRDKVSRYCGLPVAFTNDANAAAYGEYWVGTGKDFHSLVLFTLGTGIGCGIIIDDLAIEGENSHGAECGHIIIDCSPEARLCSCGRRGHLEAYASAIAVVERTREALQAGRQSSLRGLLGEGQELTPRLLASEAEKGDALSLEIVSETARYLAVGIVCLIHTIDPNGVLLGGAMNFGGKDSRLGQQFLGWIREEVRKLAFPIPAERTMIDFAGLGGDAGYIGAAGIARLVYRNR